MNKIEIHKKLCDGLNDLYAAKNHDYGDSFAKLREKFPNSILLRLNDKLNRLETLMSGEVAKVKDESVTDTLRDIANYCLLELTEREADRLEEEEKKCCAGACATATVENRAAKIGQYLMDTLSIGENDLVQFEEVGGVLTVKKGERK